MQSATVAIQSVILGAALSNAMHEHFNIIETELEAAVAATDDNEELVWRLDRLLSKVRGVRFSANLAKFGEQFAKASDPPHVDAEAPAERAFTEGQRVRTRDGYLAYVGYYDRHGCVVVNVVFQAAEYKESDLKLLPI